MQEAAESSRLIIKNIPKHISESRLREHFQQNGAQVTDVKIITKAYVATLLPILLLIEGFSGHLFDFPHRTSILGFLLENFLSDPFHDLCLLL